MKKYLLLLAAGAIALPGLAIADAHGYSQSVSGNVRINHLQTTAGDVTTAATSTGGGDTYLQWNHNYDPSETKSVTGFIRFKSGGDQRINVTGSATQGDWTANAVAEWEVSDSVSSTTTTYNDNNDGLDTDDNASTENNVTTVSSISGGTTVAERDQYVQVTNTSGLSVVLGRDAPFDSLKGSVLDYSGSLKGPASRVDNDNDGTNDAVGYHAASVDDLIDSRFHFIGVGYSMPNGVGITLRLQMDNTGNTSNILGYNIDNSLGGGTTYVYDISANAITVDYAVGPIDASVSIGSGSAETNNERQATTGTDDPSYSQDLSLTKLGLNYDAGVAQVHVNYTATSLETSDTSDTTTDYSGMNIGVSAAAGGGTVIFDLTNTSLQEDFGGNATADEEETGSATELGYLTSIGGASFKAIYGTGSYDDNVDGNTDDDSYLHLRLEYGF